MRTRRISGGAAVRCIRWFAGAKVTDMRCPICDQKPMNCDCTETERRQYCEIEELQEQISGLTLTDAERQAIEYAAYFLGMAEAEQSHVQVLENLLARCSAGSGDESK